MNLNHLALLAANKKPIPDAPVSARCSIDMNASLEQVWTKLTDVERWPNWYPYLRNAKLHGRFEAGTRLTYGGLIMHDLHIALVERPNLVTIYGTLMGYTAITRWDLEKLDPSRTRVSFSESSDGLLLGLLYSKKKLALHLQTWLDRLKAELERVKE